MSAPKTRGECESVPRPCPHSSCRFNNSAPFEEGTRKRSLGVISPENSCALDVADRGEHTLEEVGEIFGLTRERVRQVEEKALGKLRERLEKRGLSLGLLFGRRSGAEVQPGDEDIGLMEDLKIFKDGIKELPAPPFRRVEVTADGRRVGDEAQGTIKKRRGGFSFYHLRQMWKARGRRPKVAP